MADRDPERVDRFLRRALELARRGAGLASPNPMVGAVVVSGDGIVGEGWHEGPGTAHAEVMALGEAGERSVGGTLFVTLEPCTHHGRTPPCAPQVAAAGIAEAVVAAKDPNPVVDGRGLEHLRGAGVRVTILHDPIVEEAEDLIAGFRKHVTTGLPFVTLKMASSLDGKVAARDGSSRWISGEDARQDVHRLRSTSDAILVGAGTAIADTPALTVRLDGYRGRPPLRVLVDARGRTSSRGPLFDDAAPTLVATTSAAPKDVRDEWEAAGAEVLLLEEAAGGVSLSGLMEALGKRGVQSALIEGGPTLAGSALKEGLIDRLVLYLAPKLIGGTAAPGVITGAGIETIAEAIRLRIRSVERIGDDLKVVADVHGDR